MLEDFPCALTPAQTKTLTSALGQNFWCRPLTGVTGPLAFVGAAGAFALFVFVMYHLDRWHRGTPWLLLFWVAYMCAVSMVRRRNVLIKKLYDHITSVDDTAAPADSLSSAQS